jgi:amidohydrolase
MPGRDELKRAACAAIDQAQSELFDLGDDVFNHAELGFKEQRTAGLVAERLRGLGLAPRERLAITGVKAVAESGTPGPRVAVLGELDGLLVPNHPHAVAETGGAHACGHNGQLAAMLGVGIGLVRSGVLGELAGSLVLFAVPAEEYVELEYRIGLREQGKLEFLAGKQELIKLGEFDDVELALMVHNTPRQEDGLLALATSHNGLVAKRARFIGRAAHAGASPHRGINALNAATLAYTAIHFQRETFRDDDAIRVHPIITRGGEVVNIVPDDVRLETFVRGKRLEAYLEAAEKIDRALRAGAYAVGASVEITTLPGYAPLKNDPRLEQVFTPNAVALVGEAGFGRLGHRAGSTDMGDLGLVMPVVHPYAGGARGTPHGADYEIVDRAAFYLNPAKAMAMTMIDLLADDAATARDVLSGSAPAYSKEGYLACMRGLANVERYDGARAP